MLYLICKSIKRSDVFNGSDVEALKSIRMEVVAHESGKVEEALLQLRHWIAGGVYHFYIIPNLGVELFVLAPGVEESGVLISFLKNVDGNEACASGKLRRPIFQKWSVVELEF